MKIRSILTYLLLLSATALAQYSIVDLVKGMGGTSDAAIARSMAAQPQPLQGSSGLGHSDESVPIASLITDGKIDPDAYTVGTGDIFSIYLWGATVRNYSLSVNIDGYVTIPLVGTTHLAGLTYRQSCDSLANRIKAIFKNVQYDISLQQPRRFKVHIGGEVEQPGTYIIDGMTRVSEAIVRAGGLKKGCDTRKILLISADNDTSSADIARVYNTGDISHNPYIPEGTRICVMPMSTTIEITGAVNFPGTYAYRPEESLSDIIALAGGFGRGADTSKIIINRFVNNNDSLVTFEVGKDNAASFVIQPDDRILSCRQPSYRDHRGILISGEIKYPGYYPIRNDKTHLVDVIAMAGGLTDQAYLKGSKIIRKEMNSVGEREFNRLKSVPPNNLNPLERSYLKTMQTEEDGLMSIDFEKLFANGSDLYNIVLRDSDEVIIEKKPLSVKVMGAVVTPGLVSFKDGMDYRYYIEQAGGYNSGARKAKIKIIDGGSEVMASASSDRLIVAGDAVWVPEREYHNGFALTKDILMTIGSVATIIVMSFTIRNAALDK